MTDDSETAVNRMLYYARRAGYLEGALQVIAWGTSGVDPQLAAQRALDAVGEDVVVNGSKTCEPSWRSSCRKSRPSSTPP